MKLKNLIPLAALLFASCAEEQSLTPCRTTVPLGISLHARPSFHEIDSGEQNDGSGGGQTRANAEAGSAWAGGDRVMLHAHFTYTLDAAEKSADIYATLTYDGSAWSSSHPDVSLNGSGQLNASLVIDELATDVGSTAVLYYAPELQWDTTTGNTLARCTDARTTAPELWTLSGTAATPAWKTEQARLRVYTGIPDVTITLAAGSNYAPADGFQADTYTATTDADGNAYFYGSTTDPMDGTATTGTFTITRSDRTGKTSYTATTDDPLTLTAGKAYLLNNAIVEMGGITADNWSSMEGDDLKTE